MHIRGGRLVTKKIKNNIELIWAALLLSLTLGIIAPLELYFSNFDSFWFGPSEIWLILTSVFIVLLSLIIGLGFVLPEKLISIYTAIVIAFGACFYVQGNFLNLNVGLFDGKQVVWADYNSRFALNIVVWLVLIVLFSALGVVLQKKQQGSLISFLCILLLGMQIAGLASLVAPKLMSNKDGVWVKNQRIISDKNLYSVGSEDNIIVIVLDTFDDNFFKDYINTDDALLDHFDGFTFYENHSGIYSNTYYSMASIINGSLFKNEAPLLEWVDNQSERYNYYDELEENGYKLSMYTTETDRIPSYLEYSLDNCIDGELKFRNERTKFSLIYRMVVCKYFPDIAKKYFWMNGTEFGNAAVSLAEYNRYSFGNSEFIDGYKANNGIDVIQGESCFKLIHLYGAHEPYFLDEKGDTIDPHYDSLKMTRGLMTIIADYLDGLKESGVYDKCSVMITADHGCLGWYGIISNPAMLIKPAGSRGELETSNVPTSHADIAATIIDLAGGDDYDQFGESILRVSQEEGRKRYYYGYSYAPEDDWQPIFINGNHALVEYSVPKMSNNPWGYELTDVEITPLGKQISHSEFCQSCADGTELSSYDDWPVRRHVWKDNYPR